MFKIVFRVVSQFARSFWKPGARLISRSGAVVSAARAGAFTRTVAGYGLTVFNVIAIGDYLYSKIRGVEENSAAARSAFTSSILGDILSVEVRTALVFPLNDYHAVSHAFSIAAASMDHDTSSSAYAKSLAYMALSDYIAINPSGLLHDSDDLTDLSHQEVKAMMIEGLTGEELEIAKKESENLSDIRFSDIPFESQRVMDFFLYFLDLYRDEVWEVIKAYGDDDTKTPIKLDKVEPVQS